MYMYICVCMYMYLYINYSMNHGHQEGVCLQRQSSTEKSSHNIFPHKFLSLFKLHPDYSISEAAENHFIRQGQNYTLNTTLYCKQKTQISSDIPFTTFVANKFIIITPNVSCLNSNYYHLEEVI